MTPTPPTPPAAETLVQLHAKIEKAQKELSAMCERQWAGKAAIDWRIPADPARDSDLLISDGLMAGADALRRLQSTEQEMVKRGVESEQALQRAEAAEHELSRLNGLCARRPALDQPTLYDNVAKAIRVAGEKTDECVRLERRAEAAEARVRTLEQEKATRCRHCGAYQAECEGYKAEGKIACCPECAHGAKP